MRAIDDKKHHTEKKRTAVSRAKAAKKGRHVLAGKASTDRMVVEYPHEAFELLSKLPKGSADCYQAEDDDL